MNFQSLDKNCEVILNKAWFDTPIFWSSKDGQLMKIESIIVIAIKNSPIYTTIAVLYFLFGEQAILDTLKENSKLFEENIINRVDRTIKLCKEIDQSVILS